jgi:hypothetical protein
MQAIAYQTKPIHPPRFPWLLVVAFVAVAVGLTVSHALTRHQQGAIDARNCFDQHGNAMRWYNPFRDNYIMVCQERPGEQVYMRIIRRINGKLEELTAYPKDHCYWLEDVAKILEDQGSVLEWTR